MILARAPGLGAAWETEACSLLQSIRGAAKVPVGHGSGDGALIMSERSPVWYPVAIQGREMPVLLQHGNREVLDEKRPPTVARWNSNLLQVLVQHPRGSRIATDSLH